MSKIAEIYEKAFELLGLESVNYIGRRFGIEGLIKAMEEQEYEAEMDVKVQEQPKVSLGRLGIVRRKRYQTNSENISEEKARRIQNNKSEIRIQNNRDTN